MATPIDFVSSAAPRKPGVAKCFSFGIDPLSYGIPALSADRSHRGGQRL